MRVANIYINYVNNVGVCTVKTRGSDVTTENSHIVVYQDL